MTPELPLHHYLAVGAVLFALGLVGFLARRNLIVMFLCAEMMLQGVAINLVAFARFRGNLEGQAFTLFVITVAACEAGISDHAASLEADIAEAINKTGIDVQWSAASLALYTQAVIQGAFILAKAKNGPQIASDCLEHLRRYLQMLFRRPEKKE